MKPHRLTLTNSLVLGYGLDKYIHNFFCPRPATKEELESYHDSDYIDFLSRYRRGEMVEYNETDTDIRVSPTMETELKQSMEQFNCVEDCPIFAEMYDFCRKYAGASLAGARRLALGNTDIAINWSGGLHHAKRGEASGFCYINDIVLAILELLKYYIVCSISFSYLFISDTIPACSTSILTFTMATASNLRSGNLIES